MMDLFGRKKRKEERYDIQSIKKTIEAFTDTVKKLACPHTESYFTEWGTVPEAMQWVYSAKEPMRLVPVKSKWGGGRQECINCNKLIAFFSEEQEIDFRTAERKQL